MFKQVNRDGRNLNARCSHLLMFGARLATEAWAGIPLSGSAKHGCVAMLKKHIGIRQRGRFFQSKRHSLVVGNVNRYVLKPILKKLGLPYGTSHAFRHGCVSRFQEAGVHGDLITKGWSHLAEDDQQIRALHS
jgi:integrase